MGLIPSKEVIHLSEGEAAIGNSIIDFLMKLPPEMSYPERTENVIHFVANHGLRWMTTTARLKSIVLEAILRHVLRHGQDRFTLCQNEYNEILSPKDNSIVRPPLNGFRFLCPTWNDLWTSFTGKAS